MNIPWGWIALALVLAAGIVWFLDRPKQSQASITPGQPGIFSSIFGGFMAFWSNWFRSTPTVPAVPTESAEVAALRAQLAALQRMLTPAAPAPPIAVPLTVAPPAITTPVAVPVIGGGTIVTNSQGMWAIGTGLQILLNGVHAAGGYGTRIKNVQDVIFVLGTDANWWRWSGAGWANVGTVEPTAIIAPFMPVAPPPPSLTPEELDYQRRVAERDANLALWAQQGAVPANTPTLVYNGKTYDTKAIYDRFMALNDFQRSAVLSTDQVVGNAVTFWLGRSPAERQFGSQYLVGGSKYYFGGYDNSTGQLSYTVNGQTFVETIVPLY